jgi:hypothetical protein
VGAKVRALARDAAQTHRLFNNCYLDSALLQT